MEDYTLLILTMNRSVLLARLLRHLSAQAIPFPVIVLDASRSPIQSENAAMISALPLRAEHKSLSSGCALGEAAYQGASCVTTPFCSILPDDDILQLGGLEASLDFLRKRRDFVAAHGYYVGFSEHGETLQLTDLQDWCPSVDAEEPLHRLYRHMARYQPMTYAVYSTETLLRSLRAARQLQNLLLFELSQAFLAIREGKLARLPLIYKLRRNDGSLHARRKLHVGWQFLQNPEKLLSDYAVYRVALIDAYSDGGSMNRGRVARAIDLMHGLFFQRHFDAGPMRHCVERFLGMLTEEEIAAGNASPAIQALLDQPAVVSPPVPRTQFLDRNSIFGTRRRYGIAEALIYSQNPEAPLSKGDVDSVVESLASYA